MVCELENLSSFDVQHTGYEVTRLGAMHSTENRLSDFATIKTVCILTL